MADFFYVRDTQPSASAFLALFPQNILSFQFPQKSNFVFSDFLAGLILLNNEQKLHREKTKKFLVPYKGPFEEQDTSTELRDSSSSSYSFEYKKPLCDWMTLENSLYFFKFAAACYGNCCRIVACCCYNTFCPCYKAESVFLLLSSKPFFFFSIFVVPKPIARLKNNLKLFHNMQNRLKGLHNWQCKQFQYPSLGLFFHFLLLQALCASEWCHARRLLHELLHH